MMKLQDGKRYIQRNGKVSGVVKKICDTTYDFWIPENNFRSYMKNGMISITGYDKSDYDLISEYKPVAFIDEHGNIVIVGYDAFKKASFVDYDRAFPSAWKELKIDGVKDARTT